METKVINVSAGLIPEADRRSLNLFIQKPVWGTVESIRGCDRVLFSFFIIVYTYLIEIRILKCKIELNSE